MNVLNLRMIRWVASVAALWMCACSLSAGEVIAPTFNKDIAPVLFQNCSTCHHPGEVAPFSLLTYKDAKKHADDIASVTKSRFMPPWKAEAGHGEFLGERRLTDAQISLIRAWNDAGAPEGNAADLPAQPKFADGWYLGEPDMVIKLPEAYSVPGEGRDIFRIFVVPLKLDEDKYVRAMEFRPSNRKVVHHALLFLDGAGQARKLDEQDPGPGYGRTAGIGFVPSGGLGGWAPGIFPVPLPDDIGRYVRKGSDLVVQIHFHPSGKVEKEQSTIGLYFHKKKPAKLMTPFPIQSKKIDIPAGEKNYKVTASITSPMDVELVGIMPHAHLICKEMKVWATLPGGKQQDLILIKDWDFNWQDQYLYKKPIRLPSGTKVDMEFTYDNSSDNVRNPSNPPQRVKHGQQTLDEMAITFLNIVPLGLPDLGDLGNLRDRIRGGLNGERK